MRKHFITPLNACIGVGGVGVGVRGVAVAVGWLAVWLVGLVLTPVVAVVSGGGIVGIVDVVVEVVGC